MKNLLAIIVVAILATSAMFAQAGLGGNASGVCEVTVNHVNIFVAPSAPVAFSTYPGNTNPNNTFVFGFGGSLGVSWVATGAWTTPLPVAYFEVNGSLDKTSGTFDSTPMAGNPFAAFEACTYSFTVKTLPGTPDTKYTGTYTLTVNYL